MKPRYFVIGDLGEDLAADATLVRTFAVRNEWVDGQDTFLHDATSLLGADAIVLGDNWEESEYLVALLAVARGCGKRVLDAVTLEESEMGVFVWRCADEVDLD